MSLTPREPELDRKSEKIVTTKPRYLLCIILYYKYIYSISKLKYNKYL